MATSTVAEGAAEGKKYRRAKKASLTKLIKTTERFLSQENKEKVEEYVKKMMDAFDDFEEACHSYEEFIEESEVQACYDYHFTTARHVLKTAKRAAAFLDWYNLALDLEYYHSPQFLADHVMHVNFKLDKVSLQHLQKSYQCYINSMYTKVEL